jgi:hypothetical protein
MPENVSAFLSEKLGEYRILAAPLQRATREMEYAHQLLRARVESEIALEVPALGALADILEVSLLDVLMAPDRSAFLHGAMNDAGLTSEQVLQQLRALGPPPAKEALVELGLPVS